LSQRARRNSEAFHEELAILDLVSLGRSRVISRSSMRRDTYTVGRKAADLFAFGDFSGAAVDGFVRMLVSCRAASPFEQADAVAADLEVCFRGAVTVGAEEREKAVEGFLGEGPFFPRTAFH